MTPVAHTSLAILGFELIDEKKNYLSFLYLVLLSNFPDIDLLINLLLPRGVNFQHQLYTHNIFFVLFTIFLLFPLFKTKRDRLILFFLGFSHLIIDLIVIDLKEPIGFRLFYPLYNKYFNFGFFPTFYKANLSYIFSLHNLFVVLLEALIFFFPVVYYFRREIKRDIFTKNFLKR